MEIERRSKDTQYFSMNIGYVTGLTKKVRNLQRLIASLPSLPARFFCVACNLHHDDLIVQGVWSSHRP